MALLAIGAIAAGAWLVSKGKSEPASGPVNPNTPKGLAPNQVLGYVRGIPVAITTSPVGNGQVLRTDAAQAFLALQAAAKAAGHNLSPVSGFRSNEQQAHLYEGWMKKLPGYNLAAKPGWSNHQGGVSIDIGNVNSYTTPAYKWLAANAARFGFKNDVATEYWHWTFTS